MAVTPNPFTSDFTAEFGAGAGTVTTLADLQNELANAAALIMGVVSTTPTVFTLPQMQTELTQTIALLTDVATSLASVVVAPPPNKAESPAGTLVPLMAVSLNASATPGYAGSGNLIEISTGQQLVINGTINAATAEVTQLYYVGHTAFHYSGGAWYGPITAKSSGALVHSPLPWISLRKLTCGLTAGSVIAPVYTFVGAGSYGWSYTISGINAAKFKLLGGSLVSAVALPAGDYPITLTAVSGNMIATGTFTITAATLIGKIAAAIRKYLS